MFRWFKALSVARKVLALGVAAVVGIGVAGAAAGPTTSQSNSLHPTQTKAVQAENVQVKTETATKSIPFQTTTRTDPSLDSGTTKVTTTGINGVETITYKVAYTNGIQTSKVQASDVVTTPPVTQVTSMGSYVAPALNCPNGTYVNTAGNTVCSPYSASSAPSGATAQCGDGSYSFSQSRSGTCSHHGGVATWL